MTDPAQRRISKAFLLGFSDKPFIDTTPPAPRKPSGITTAVKTHPGGLIEWAASDGRRGRLSGSGKARALAGEAPVRATSKKGSKAASKKDEIADGGVLGVGGIFENWPATGSVKPAAESIKPAQSIKPAESVKPAKSGWTEEQDKKLIDFKNDGTNRPWQVIANELGKNKDECRERFNQIKPKDWRPASGGKNGKGKQGQSEKKDEEEKKDETQVWGWGDNTNNADNGGGNDNTWDKNNGGGDDGEWGKNNDDAGGDFDENKLGAWGDVDNKSEKKDSNEGAWVAGWEGTNDKAADNNADGGFEDNNAWGGDTGNDGANDVTAWPTANEPKNPSQKSASNKAVSNKAPSNKPLSHKSSHRHSSKHSNHKPSSKHSDRRPSNSAPPQTIYELKPDDTFSASDLRLIARILQQDTNMIWDRVSWRFRDKTGRILHADVFEEKVTGGIERRSSTK